MSKLRKRAWLSLLIESCVIGFIWILALLLADWVIRITSDHYVVQPIRVELDAHYNRVVNELNERKTVNLQLLARSAMWERMQAEIDKKESKVQELEFVKKFATENQLPVVKFNAR